MNYARLIAIIAAVLVLVVLISWGPSACSRLIAERQAHKIEEGQSEATLDSLDEAIQTEADRQEVAEAIEAKAKELADAIREAPPGDSNDATMLAVCQTSTYRDDPACVELREKANADP